MDNTSYETGKRYIVVLTNGWVFVGTLEKHTTTDAMFTDASNIRVWGTSKGLGELANNGPTGTTKLDPCGKFIAKHIATLFVVPVTSEL